MEDISASGKKKGTSFLKKYFTLTNVTLFIILIAAALIRFRRLTKQSLWLDELQTMLNSDPKISWADFFNEMKNGEVTCPPLYFIAERYFLYFFGYNDFAARALSALGGIASILAIFFLGKEIKNEKLGLIAAALTCVNYFNIYHSQEARVYTFLWLFTTLSYLYFLRVCKYLKTTDAILLVISTLCLVYTHYFGFLVIISQLVIAVFFLFQEKEKKKKLFITLFFSELSILIAYLPWIPYLKVVGNIHSMWIAPIRPDFFIEFFNNYFGYSHLLSLIVAAFILIYFINVFVHIKGFRNLKANPVNLSFIFIITSIIISLGIPYIRSVLVVPMIISRYSIVVLPPLIIAIAYGIESVPNKIIGNLLLGCFLVLSMYHLIFINKYYRTITKPQVREVTAFITSDNQNHTIINGFNPFQQQYYLKQDNFKGQFLMFSHRYHIDHILQKSSPAYDVDTFWLVGTHNCPYLETYKQNDLDTAFFNVIDTTFYLTWAQMYVSKKSVFQTIGPLFKTIDYTFFKQEQSHYDNGKVIAIWSKDIASKPVELPKGKYNLIVELKGTPVAGVYPHNNVYINEKKMGAFFSIARYKCQFFPFEIKNDTSAVIKVNMDNDTSTNDEDRNTFIRNIYILKSKN